MEAEVGPKKLAQHRTRLAENGDGCASPKNDAEPEQPISVNDIVQAAETPENREIIDETEYDDPLGWEVRSIWQRMDDCILRGADRLVIGVEACEPAASEEPDFEKATRSGD